MTVWVTVGTMVVAAGAVTAGVLAVTGFVLWRAGVFDRPQASTNEFWVYNPQQKPMGFRFFF